MRTTQLKFGDDIMAFWDFGFDYYQSVHLDLALRKEVADRMMLKPRVHGPYPPHRGNMQLAIDHLLIAYLRS